jgi:hypothetical protein
MTLDGEPFRGPDAKTGPKERKPTRTLDRSLTAKSCLEWRECPCGKPSATGHHVISRGKGGDDVLPNIVPLCGSGTTGCHGLVENADEKARRRLGKWIGEHRPDTIVYVRSKMGDVAGDDWLNRYLFVPKASLRRKVGSTR